MDSTSRNAFCKVLETGLGLYTQVPLVGWLASAGVGLACSKFDANDKYRQLIPLVRSNINTFGRNSPQAKTTLDLLGELPLVGACRENFRRAYIDKPDGWRELPDDPADLPFGFWY